MSKRQPIDTAPKDGRKVRVFWTDFDGQENDSLAHYRALAQLQRGGGEWDDGDTGWWTFIDSDTQKRILPHSWSPDREGDDDA